MQSLRVLKGFIGVNHIGEILSLAQVLVEVKSACFEAVDWHGAVLSLSIGRL